MDDNHGYRPEHDALGWAAYTEAAEEHREAELRQQPPTSARSDRTESALALEERLARRASDSYANRLAGDFITGDPR